MAKLRQALDGHYYVQLNIFGQGIATYQITLEGVRFLATKRIYVDEEILPAYMKRMRDAGFAYTGGSGLGQVNLATTTPDLDFEKVTFVLRESRSTWNLGIYIPELSTDLIAKVDSKSLTGKLSLRVNENSLPVARLWPGKGGAIIDVEPSLKAYQFRLVGPWPKCNIPNLPKDFRLSTDGERFLIAGQVARRLHWAAPMELGSSYLALMRLPLPEKGVPEDLQYVGSDSLRKSGWFLYSFSIPESNSETLPGWCSHLGFALQEKAWKLSLLSPPPTKYSDEGIAVINSPSVIIAAKRPESGTKQLDLVLQRAGDVETSIQELKLKLPVSEASGFVSLRVPNAGTFVIRGLNTWVSPLAIRFDPESGSEAYSPRPLEVIVNGECVEGISSSSASQELLVGVPDCSIELDSPVPVAIDCAGRYAEFDSTEKASTYLKTLWAELYASRLPTVCKIFAGNFGSVFLSLKPRNLSPSIATVKFQELAIKIRFLKGNRKEIFFRNPQRASLLVPLSSRMRTSDRQRARLIFRGLQQS